MQLACIVCISAFLVITFWCNVVYCEENAETKHTNNALQRTNVSFKHENYKFGSIVNSISAKNASHGELPKEESVSLGNQINDVASNIQNGGFQQQKLFSPISSDRIHSTRVEDATLESLASTNVGSNNDVKGSTTKLHNTTFGLTSLTNSINNEVKLAEENSIQDTSNNNSTEAREGQTTTLPKVLDPSFEILTAISRRAKRSNSNQQEGNHDRTKRSSFSIDNVDFTGGKKYIKNIIGIENSDYQYRSPWRIPSYKSYSHKDGAVSKDIKRKYPSHMKSQSSDVKTDIVQPSLEVKHYIPVVSSLQDEYHKQKSSDYLKSLPYVSVDGTSKRNSISSLPSSLPYSLSPELKEDISSSQYNRFDFKKSIYLQPYQKYSDQQHRQQPYRGHQVHNHNDINYHNSNILNENKSNLKESVLHHNRPIFPETLKLSSANKVISRKSTESSANEEPLQDQQKGESSSLLVLPPAVEEPLVLASRVDPSRGGQREQLPAATSDIISAGKSMVRGIMKRRLKTGRYDVPQVGKYPKYIL